MAYVYGSQGLTNNQAQARLYYYKNTDTNTSVSYIFYVQIYANGAYSTSAALNTSLSCSGQTTHTTSGQGASLNGSGDVETLSGPHTYTFSKTTSQQTKTVYFSLKSTGSTISGTSSGSVTLTIPTLTKYTITYKNGGHGTAPSSQTKYYGKSITLKPAISATGYTFKKWSSSADSKTYSAGGSYTANKSTTMTATWSTNSHTLTANANGGNISATTGWSGTGGTATKSINYNASYGTLPTVSRIGYNLYLYDKNSTGWYTTATGNTNVTTGSTMDAANKTIYARWTEIIYSITYSGVDDPSTYPDRYTITSSTITLPTPTKQQYNFLGWTEGDSSTLMETVTIPTGSYGNKTYTANWERAITLSSLNITACKRTNSDGSFNDSGTYAFITFNWTNAEEAGEIRTPNTYDLVFTNQEDSSDVISLTNRSFSNSELTNRKKTIIIGDTTPSTQSNPTNYIDTEKSYIVTVTLHFKDKSFLDVNTNDYISKAYFIIDINRNGTAIGFGGPVEDNNAGFYCNMDAHFKDKNNIIRALFDFVYPVGSYYETSDITFNPNVTWGGRWSLETEGQVHVSAGTNYTVAGALTNTSDDGEATHTLEQTEIPKFEGSVRIRGYKTSSTSQRAAIVHGSTGIISVGDVGTNTANGIMAASGISDLGSNPLTVSFGGGQAHNNMQPYIVVNRWHRTA